MNLTSKISNHESKWCDCTKCSLGKTATNHVLWEGSIPAHYLFISDAPNSDEDAIGELLMGKEGKILLSMFKAVHLTSKDYCYTTALACFPSKPDDPTTFRNPKKDEIQTCSPRLVELINLVKPKAIILLGDVAKTLFNKYLGLNASCSIPEKILELRHPLYINRDGGIGSVEYKRNLIKLKAFING